MSHVLADIALLRLGIYAGGVRVDEEFKIFLRRTLTQIKWDSGEDDLEDMIADGFQSFLDTIKCTYVSSRGVYQLKVGGRRLNVHDGSVTIKRGELAIEGYVTSVKRFTTPLMHTHQTRY